MDGKKALNPELKEIYDRIMNTSTASTPAKEVEKKPQVSHEEVKKHEEPEKKTESPAPHTSTTAQTIPPDSFTFSSKKSKKMSMSKSFIVGGIVVFLAVWVLFWAVFFNFIDLSVLGL